MPPPVEDMSDEESGDIPFKDAPEVNGTDDQNAEEQDEEDDEIEEEGVYVVERIVSHAWLDDGTLKLLVKWQGYEDESDQTWEEEEGLMEGAAAIVKEYYKQVGGRPTQPRAKSTSGKPGRKRKSLPSSTPSENDTGETGAKRQRRKSAPKGTEPKRTTTKKETRPETDTSEEDTAEWVPRGRNWDKDVKTVDTIVRGEGDEGLMAWLEFNNGHKAKISLEVCYEKCPLKMLKFYEQHLVFKDV